MKKTKETKDELRAKLVQSLISESILVSMSVAKAIDEFIDVDVTKAFDTIRNETLEEVENFFKDHYWDSFEQEKSLLMKHLDFIINKLKTKNE